MLFFPELSSSMPSTKSTEPISDKAGTIWAYIQNWAARGITIVVFFVLARLLTPAEFGAFAVAMVFVTLGEVFVEQMFGHVIVQRTELTEAHLSSAFWATLLIAATLVLATFLAAPVFATAFDSPGIEPVIMALSPVFIFMALASVPAALLRRELNYRTLARRTALSNLLSGIAAIVAAASGFGVWTFVLQQLVYQSVGTWVLWRNESWRPQLMFQRVALSELFSFSSRITFVKMLDLIETRLVELLIAKHVGIASLGNYALAIRAQQSAQQLLAAPLWESSISIFARMQTDRSALAVAFRDRTLLVVIFIMPAFLFAAGSAKALIPAVFGAQWQDAVAPFQVLCILGAMRSLIFLYGAAMQAVGAASISVWVAVIRTAATLLVLPFTFVYGPVGVAWTLVVGQIAALPIIFWLFSRTMTFPSKVNSNLLLRPIATSLVATLIGAEITNILLPTTPVFLVAALSIAASIAIFLTLGLFTMTETIIYFVSKLSGMRNRVCISGAFGERNFGDDLLMWCSCSYLYASHPGINIYISVGETKTPNYIEKTLPKAKLFERFSSFRKYWTREFLAGGTQFYSFPSHIRDRRSTSSRVQRLVNKVRIDGPSRTLIRTLLKKLPIKPRCLAVGIGIGPFQSGNEDASRNVLERIDRIWVRDQKSLEFPSKWGFTNIADGADICFANGLIALPEKTVKNDSKLVGVVIRGWDFTNHSSDFQESIRLTCERLVSDGFKVKVFSFCASVDQNAIEFFRSAGFTVVTWCPDSIQATTYLTALDECAFFISSRFHGVVVGALLGKPSIGIALDPKVAQICQKLELNEFIWESPFDAARLWDQVMTMYTNHTELVKRVENNRHREGLAADQMMRDAVSLLLK